MRFQHTLLQKSSETKSRIQDLPELMYFDFPKQVQASIVYNLNYQWSVIVPVLSGRSMEKKRLFCVRYSFQAAIYALWRERNKIKHGEKPMSIEMMKKLVDKGIRNKLSILRMQRRKGMEGALQFWFETRV